MWQIKWLDQSSSTQKDLKNLLKSDHGLDALVLATLNQTIGFGRQNRKWISPYGNLSFSLLISNINANIAYQFGLVAALSLTKCLEAIYDISFSIKWPNDVYYKNKKVGGILSEYFHESSHLVLGVGLNLNSQISDFPAELQNRITTLKSLTNEAFSPKRLLQTFLEIYKKDYYELINECFHSFHDDIQNRLLWRNQKVEILDKGSSLAEGVLLGINKKGFLLLQKNQNHIQEMVTGDLSLRMKDN